MMRCGMEVPFRCNELPLIREEAQITRLIIIYSKDIQGRPHIFFIPITIIFGMK